MSTFERDGLEMFSLAEELWPLNRSLSGDGVRQTLSRIQEKLPSLEICEIASGEQFMDWIAPLEWKAQEAFLVAPSGQRICDFSVNNLHLVGYSVPFLGTLDLDELQAHLYSLPDQPDAVPYVTSYYSPSWGFCLTHNDRVALEPGAYEVVVRTSLFSGVLNYGEVVLPGTSKREVFFSTYVCHPSMANNELSGPVLAAQLASMLEKENHFYTYRFVFIPETIGSISYISRHLNHLQKTMLAGFVLTCVGDERGYSFLPSRLGTSVADRAALESLEELKLDFAAYSWLDRGSDERQYCAPGVDLPVCSIMRSKYGTYPEYHTDQDKLGTVVTAQGLASSLQFYRELIKRIESKRFPRARHLGEPQLGRRGLYPNTSIKGVYAGVQPLLDVLSMCDGYQSISEIAGAIGLGEPDVTELLDLAMLHDLVDW